MAKQEMICGLDVGSSQISCIIGTYDADKDLTEIISASRVPCRGVSGGVVVDIGEAAQGIARAVEECEEKASEHVKDYVKEVRLGIRGPHIETVNNRGVVSILRTDKEISVEDKINAISNAKAIHIPPDRIIIDEIVQEYYLDRQRGVKDPVGMEGNHLEVYIHIVTASNTHLGNIYKAISNAGFSISEPVIYGLIALGDTVVTNEEKELGCLLIDFGGQTTGLAVYADKSIRFSKELPIGSEHITKDISYALRTSIAQAREIKERYCVAAPSLLDKDEEIEFTGVDGRTLRKTSKSSLAETVSPRVEEIFDKIDEEIQNQNFSDIIIPGGVILTGGGSMLEGIDKACEQVLGVGTRLGIPQGIKGPNDIVSNPVYATCVGLLKYKSASQEGGHHIGFLKRAPLWQKFRDIFR